ncbi:hypothetical protein KIH27_05570 [Mycobacterium sp. M1]|uniref:PIN domain-containing protein n=1 Tax=Mycolicibacter acidiphilus TaxID=2835306 RepID=A0ABS5RFK6_9MYCO|nr:hypothetical protein [Mycolicibacter acidiphilus]MBS9533057.1 hypothetical protein [Mycolicibacter acidiphilus]
MIVIGDTSGLVAAFNSADPEHLAVRRVLIEAALTVISPWCSSRSNRSPPETSVAARRWRSNAVFTIDRRDFRAVSPLTGAPAFRVLPDDS